MGIDAGMSRMQELFGKYAGEERTYFCKSVMHEQLKEVQKIAQKRICQRALINEDEE